MSYLRPRVPSNKLHPLELIVEEIVCVARFCPPSNKRMAEARGDEGNKGEEAKGEGGEAGGCLQGFLGILSWISLS